MLNLSQIHGQHRFNQVRPQLLRDLSQRVLAVFEKMSQVFRQPEEQKVRLLHRPGPNYRVVHH